MTDKFLNKYRIESTRLAKWDYRSSGYYFITLCTKNRQCFFGEINNKKVMLSKAGIITQKFWQEIPQHFHNTKLDEFIIMPNHLHGIIIIEYATPAAAVPKEKKINNIIAPGTALSTANRTDAALPRLNPRLNQALPRLNRVQALHNHRPKPNSISSIIGSFKSIATREIRRSGMIDFEWQERFYDHIIRNHQALFNIRNYIINNPLKWELDRNYSNKYSSLLNHER